MIGLGLALVACSTVTPVEPVVVDAAASPGAPARPRTATAYPLAMKAIVGVMETRLGFPPFSPTLVLCRSRAQLESALVAEGLEPSYARDVARALDGVNRSGKVFANEEALARLSWPARVRFLAHELAHSAEDVLAGGRPVNSDQWLREGLAEWVSWAVVDAERLGSFAAARSRALRQVRQAIGSGSLPGISELVYSRQWVAVKTNSHEQPIYSLSFVAVDFLVERHGLQDVVAYFRLFRTSDARLANFEAAFGESWSSYESALSDYLLGAPGPAATAEASHPSAGGG